MNVDTVELAKLLASGGLTIILLYAAVTLWCAYQEAVKGRIDDLNARIEALEKGASDENAPQADK